MIILKNIEKTYGRDENRQTVLDNLSMEIHEGDMISIMGPSGSGKSTLLNVLGLLDDQYNGQFIFDGVDCHKMNKKAREILQMIGLEKHMEKKVSLLSGGQQQRVAIARALINDPRLILADEPTGALDQKTGKEIMEIFKKLNDKGRTILIVTHDKTVAGYCKTNKNMLDGKLL